MTTEYLIFSIESVIVLPILTGLLLLKSQECYEA